MTHIPYEDIIQDHADTLNMLAQLHDYLKTKKTISETLFKSAKIGTKSRSKLIACMELEKEFLAMMHAYFPWLDA